MPATEQFYLFPPPRTITENPILALTVKKTRTAEQDELHFYSPFIRAQDGHVIVCGVHNNKYNPGDWIVCQPGYAVDESGNMADEKEMKIIQKVEDSDYEKCMIPPTRLYKENVRITCLFTLCPTFIKNRQTQDIRHRKLYLFNIGQGFVSYNNSAFNNIKHHSYFGIFEFRGKGNGSVNFTRKYETDFISDREAMWELISVLDTRVSREDINKMKEKLSTLKNEAISYDAYWRGQRVQMTQTPPTTSATRNPALDVESPDEETLNNSQVIIHGMFPNEMGNLESKWKDSETGETSKSYVKLRYKLYARRGFPGDYPVPEDIPNSLPTIVQSDEDINETVFSVETRSGNNANPSSFA